MGATRFRGAGRLTAGLMHPCYREGLARLLAETCSFFSNDPAAGSPTATLLRLLLPLIWRYRRSSKLTKTRGLLIDLSQRLHLHIIGSNDGRCVQLAGT